MQKIILTTDFSAKALEINDYAIRLYGDDAEYILVHGFICDYAQRKNVEGHTFASPEEFKTFKQEGAISSMEEVISVLIERYPNLNIKPKAIEGVGIRAIETATRLLRPDLVVIGTSRLDGTPSKTHATVATRLIGSLPTSILVVPYEHNHPELSEIVFAYAQMDMNNDIYGPFKHLINKTKKNITLFHVIEGEKDVFKDEAVTDFSNFLGIKKMKIENARSRHAVESILNFCDNAKPSLLVVIAREESYRQDFWIGSKVDEISCQLKQPMLALYDAP